MASKKNNTRGKKGGGSRGYNPRVEREQPRKDSRDKRINLDNARESKVAKQIEEDSKKRSANDISDFSKNSELLKAAGNIPFAAILGSSNNDLGVTPVPGVMASYWVPSIGGGTTPFAVNQAKDSMYSFIVHANSRNYKNTSADFMIMNMAGSNAFALLASGMRCYGFLKYYSERNLYYPDTVIQALGFDPVDWRKHLPDEWFGLNEYISRMQQIWIPKTMPILKRWFDKNSHVYLDAQSPSAQTYVYVQSKFYSYKETYYTTGGGLNVAQFIPQKTRDYTDPTTTKFSFMTKSTGGPQIYGVKEDARKTWTEGEVADFVLGPDSCISWAEYCSAMDLMLQAIIDAEDRGIMYGDILKAYGAENLYSVSPMDVNFALAPEYNAEILTQFENIETVQGIFPKAFVQSDNLVGTLWESELESSWSGSANSSIGLGNYPIANNLPGTKHLINFHFPGQPSPEAVMIATRGKACSTDVLPAWRAVENNDKTGFDIMSESNFKLRMPISTSCELVNLMVMFTDRYSISPNNDISNFRIIPQYYMGNFINQGLEDGLYTVNYLTCLGQLMAFDWHPFIYDQGYRVTDGKSDAIPKLRAGFGDFDNYTIIDDEVLSKLNDTALYSVWGLPQVGL